MNKNICNKCEHQLILYRVVDHFPICECCKENDRFYVKCSCQNLIESVNYFKADNYFVLRNNKFLKFNHAIRNVFWFKLFKQSFLNKQFKGICPPNNCPYKLEHNML